MKTKYQSIIRTLLILIEDFLPHKADYKDKFQIEGDTQ